MRTAGQRSALENSYDDWAEYFRSAGEAQYRAGQICDWLWKRGVWDVESMTNLGLDMRENLSRDFDFSRPVIKQENRSPDGTKKFLIHMPQGSAVETALLRQGPRLTACLSTQVGCPVGCPFCATGAGGFERNLSAGEIASQLVVMEKHLGRAVQNVVMMGMGEPFLNTEATLDAIRVLNSPKMRGLGIRHITVSTAGIAPGIRELAESGLGVRLAVSLHAAADDLRSELVPCSSDYPLGELMSALRDYQRVTGDRITIEYAMFKGTNDSVEHARALVHRLHGIHAYINLIPANEFGGYARSSPESVLKFQSVLRSAGFETEIRTERGGEINASCGQLRRSSDMAGRGEIKKDSPRRFGASGNEPQTPRKDRGPAPVSAGRGNGRQGVKNHADGTRRRDSGRPGRSAGGRNIPSKEGRRGGKDRGR
ncbi:MAG: 23S rRNA (adenine(2503)-C(2))-methyltransferase RlmN [Synergistaceae bacterium]|nr:23S rRNA (adenine(2503)-C(2))-methyltransferase RlmN [Synergistaceae bacterium]